MAAGREPSPSEAVVDSQSVETATMISIDVSYDAGKKIHRRRREAHLHARDGRVANPPQVSLVISPLSFVLLTNNKGQRTRNPRSFMEELS